MAVIEIPEEYIIKEEIFGFLKDNKELHFKQKKDEVKRGANIAHISKGHVDKAEAPITADTSKIRVKSIINTTNILDSHSDVHMKGIWKKSLRENKDHVLLQEHVMSFKNVISEDVTASAELFKFKDVGFPRLKMETEALVFDSLISKDRNEFMFNLYAKGLVRQHSVGMRYMKMLLAVNSDSSEFKEEKEVWDKYSREVANFKAIEEQGFFWPILEAKVLEGSAVVKGSNPATPTHSVEAKDNEPSLDTQKTEPPVGTHNLHLY